MDAPLAFGLGHALHAMHAAFELHFRIDLVALHLELDFLVATSFGWGHVERLDLPLLLIGETRVHAEEVTCEDGGLVATGTGANLDDDVLVVGRVCRDEHELDVVFERRQLAFDAGDLLLCELLHLGIREHFLGLGQIVEVLHIGTRRLRERTLVGVFLRQSVVFLLIRQHGRVGHLHLQLVISLADLDQLLSFQHLNPLACIRTKTRR